MSAQSSDKYIGLSINNTVLRAVVINARTRTITDIVEEKLNKEILNGGAFLEPNIFKTALKKLINKTDNPPSCISISLPERYALTRELSFPDISDSEIAEAVNWQANTIFPLPIEDMYVDWKILKSKNSSAKEVFVVAIPKKLIDDLLELLNDLKFRPVNIQTSASCLGRLLPKRKNKTEILANINFDGTTATLVVNNVVKMTATESFSEGDAADSGRISIDVISRLIEYYKTKEPVNPIINKIWITGELANEKLKKQLEENINTKTRFLKLPISLDSKNKSLAFSEAIAIGMVPIRNPKSSETINLLPQNIQDYYDSSANMMTVKKRARQIIGIISLTLVISILGYGYLTFKSLQLLALTKTTAAQVEDESTQVKLRRLNNEVEKLNLLTAKKKTPKVILSNLPSLLPEGISIEAWEYNAGKKILYLEGKTNTRENLLQLGKTLEERNEYEQVTIPLDNLSRKTNYQFRVAVRLK